MPTRLPAERHGRVGQRPTFVWNFRDRADPTLFLDHTKSVEPTQAGLTPLVVVRT